MAYNPRQIEPKWQQVWQQQNAFQATEDPQKPKFYALDMFPYPSAAGLHVGHVLGYTATDIVSRFHRMRGFNVLHPMGWDAFGLPAEQHAIETGEHPAQLTYRNIANFKKQLNRLGMSYDWSREFATCDPTYYHWTQWIFKLLYEKNLAYQAEVSVNWCPALKTVLANEEVIDGKSERGGHPVLRVPMRQWMLKITAYAERLLEGLKDLDWPESIKDIQRNWIGKSMGAKILFPIKDHPNLTVEVFTTRPDTLMGVTYLVLAPEHPLVSQITTSQYLDKVSQFVTETTKKSDFDRTEVNKDKQGLFIGAHGIHPVTKKEIPLFIADYVIGGYGTGAVMAVPAHDERDHEFALKYKLPIVQVIEPQQEQLIDVQRAAYTGDGLCVQSDFLNGLSVKAAQTKICAYLQEKGLGESTINYKFRDWLFSRQRYWGEPIPMLKNSNGEVVRPLHDNELPLTLPEVQSYEPTADGKSPLSNVTSWVQRYNSDGTLAFVETHTMPGSAGSSWYFLRYCDPKNSLLPFSRENAEKWMPVDLYIGGQEHAVGHLLYSRFWTKVLFDAGLSPVDEPFKKLVNQGMICKNGAKMSKSKGNGVNPDDVLEQFGADSLRVYEMFMGPLTQTKEWDDSNLAGVHRFLSRIYRACVDESNNSLLTNDPPQPADKKILHKTIKKITEDIQNLSFNTSVAQMMIFLNSVQESGCKSKDIFGPFFKLISPFAPHLAQELWSICIVQTENKNATNQNSINLVCSSPWPTYDPALCKDDEVKIGVQVNGKHRGEILVQRDASQDVAVQIAKETTSIVQALDGKEIKKTIYVANRILNFVVS